jgi:hypothetical protein
VESEDKKDKVLSLASAVNNKETAKNLWTVLGWFPESLPLKKEY